MKVIIRPVVRVWYKLPYTLGASTSIAVSTSGNGVKEEERKANTRPKKRATSSSFDVSDRSWEFCTTKQLMPWPQFELGSQDTFSIPATEVRLQQLFDGHYY